MPTSKHEPLKGGNIQTPFDSPTFKLDMSIKVDAPVGAMSISPCSRDVVLASRQGLHIVDLDNPYDPPRFLQHLTAWSVADVQWSPHASHAHWVISTSNQKAIVWNLALPSHKAIEHVLHSHTRAITDINFSAHEPNILATCSIDSFIHCWDLRTPHRPAMSFCDWSAGATQVKYNRQNPHILASAHDRYLYIWDTRMGANAVRKITAHSTKIYGLDWNRTRPSGIITCSLDKCVRFWDYEYAPNDTPERIIYTSYPVWRARHTPFGWGVLTMPLRGDTALCLWDRRAKGETHEEPVAKFEGHTDHVKEFLWRFRGGPDDTKDDREFQLVTWGLDNDIRLWDVSKSVMDKVGHDPSKKMRFRITRKGAEYMTFRNEAEAVKKYAEQTKIKESSKSTPRLTLTVDGGKITTNLKGLPPLRRESLLNSQGKGALSAGIQLSQVSGGGNCGVKSDGDRRYEKALTGTREGSFMRAGRRRRVEINPITWMKGVKIARKVSENGLDASRTSARSGDFSVVWDTPENLGDEIALVGSKFPRVNFEKVNIAARTCTVSLTGPWGVGNKGIFVRADAVFPQDYPTDRKSIPEFRLEKTNNISDENIVVIDSQLRRVATSYVSRGHVCLEACLCYLLGERPDSADYVGSDGDDSSSDDEGVVNTGVNGDEEEGVGILTQSMNQASVPLPKTCGATWAPDGRLICFFPPREDRAVKSLLSTLSAREGERSIRSASYGKMWEGFGRLYMDSPARGRDDPDSEFSSADSYTTDDSSDEDVGLHTGTLRPALGWRVRGGHTSSLTRGFRRGGSTDQSTQLSTGTGVKTATTVTAKRKSIVSFHDMKYFLPAKRELAAEYRIGEGSEICKHNAAVAERHGYLDLADVWRLVGMVLCDDVPLEVYTGIKNRPGDWGDRIMVMAKRATLERGRRDSGLGSELENDDGRGSSDMVYWGKVKWGGHPLGGSWLIGQLFEYFERRADIQMLAMLSCVLSETERRNLQENSSRCINIQRNSSGHSSVCHDYYPNADMILQSQQSTYSISPSHQSATTTPLGTQGSYSSSAGGPFGSDPMLPYSTGTTPPTSSLRLGTDDFSGSHSLSSSPEHHHLPFRRSTSAISANFARATIGPANASPPSRRRPSPAESMLNPFATSGVTWGAITTFGSGSKGASSTTDATSEENEPIEPIVITMCNRETFDDEAVASLPLLSLDRKAFYKTYRENYANLLYMWNFQIERLEVLKFNTNDTSLSSPILSGFSRHPSPRPKGLEIAGHCSKCMAVLDVTSGPRGECKVCKRRQGTMTCVVCEVVIKGLYGPCLKCGHVAHAKCHREWFEDGGEASCPTGCGCICLFDREGVDNSSVPLVQEAVDVHNWESSW